MTYQEKLQKRIARTGSSLCVGLDPRPEPAKLGELRTFLEKFIAETAPHAAAFKPNIAYFEALGLDGLKVLEDILPAIPGEIPVVLDVKRGDIGETQKYYAEAYFGRWNVDAVTVNPFMGYDSVEPFLGWEGKGVYLLAVTSNPGAADIECQELAGGRRVYQLVGDMARRAVAEGKPTDVGFVLGLTNAAARILGELPDAPLLIPGLGAQGGDISALKGSPRVAPNLINVSRGIMYAEPELSYAEKAAKWAKTVAEC